MSSKASQARPAVDRGGAKTRERILDVAWDVAIAEGIGVPMRDIADRAGVSRQALYLHFPSRAHLLTAMARRSDERWGIADRAAKALAEPTAAEALEAVIRTWLEYAPVVLPVGRALLAASASDPAAAQAWNDRMSDVLSLCRATVKRLRSEGLLDPSWKTEEAAQFLWSLLHLRAWDDLVEGYGWRPQRFVERQTMAAKRVLLPQVSA